MISAVIPNYNQGQFIESAIRSLLEQTHPVDEIIVVDDGSTDKSVEIIESLQNKNLSIYLIRHPKNKGLPATRNTGIKAAKGNIIALLDADDWYYRNKIKESVKILDKYPFVGVVYSDYDVFNESHPNTYSREYKISFSVPIFRQSCIISTNSVVRKDLFVKSGYYDENIKVAEDYDLWCRSLQHYLAYHIPEPLFGYRVHAKSITSSQTRQVIENTNMIRAKYGFSKKTT